MLRLLSRKQGERYASVLTAPGRAILYLNLCAVSRESCGHFRSSPVLSFPALPCRSAICYACCLHANWIRRLTCQVLAIVIHATFPFR